MLNDVGIRTLRGRHDGHADVVGQFGESLDDAMDLNGFRPQVILIVVVASLAQPADGRIIDACLLHLNPRAQPVAHVAEIPVLVQGHTDLREGAFSGFVVPDLGVHQDAVVIEEDVVLHGWGR
jgi:hypothetical protein